MHRCIIPSLVHAHINVYAHIYACMHMYTQCIHMRTHTCTHVHTSTHTHTHTHVHTYAFVRSTHTNTFVNMHACTCTQIYRHNFFVDYILNMHLFMACKNRRVFISLTLLVFGGSRLTKSIVFKTANYNGIRKVEFSILNNFIVI